MANEQDCSKLPEAKKKSIGCGTTCGCARMKKGLNFLDHIQGLRVMLENEWLHASEIDDIHWALVEKLMIEDHRYKEERKAFFESMKAKIDKADDDKMQAKMFGQARIGKK